MWAVPRKVIIFRAEDGSEPFTDWLSTLRDSRGKALIHARIARLELGLLGDAQPVGRGVMELRIHHGPGYRIYVGLQGSTVVVLLCGGTKGSQKQDIRNAQSYWAEYKSEG